MKELLCSYLTVRFISCLEHMANKMV